MVRSSVVLVGALAAVVAIAGATTDRAQAGAGFFPPLEVELGRSAIATRGGPDVGATELLVGMSFASLYPKPTPVDVSLGWVASFVPAIDEPVVGPSMDRPANAGGAFVAVDWRAVEGKHWRGWLGGRGELMATEDVGVLGGFGRASIELWHPVMAGGGGGGIMGAVALSAWMEVGVRERPDRSLARVASAGIGLRLPLVAGR